LYVYFTVLKEKENETRMKKTARKKRNLRKIAAKEEKKEVRLTHGFFDPWFFPWG